MASLSWRNLSHDRVRLTVTITGIVFAIFLTTVQLGLFIGFRTTISGVIDHSNVDLWVASQDIQNFDAGAPFPERKRYLALATTGVEWAEKYSVSFTRWKRPDGGEETVEVVGYNVNTGVGGPWNLVAGDVNELKNADTVIIDDTYCKKLGVKQLGEIVEINKHRARVVGFTHGIRSFTTSPFVFTSFKNSLNYVARVDEDQMIYLLVKAQSGVNLAELKSRLAARLQKVDVYTTAEFSSKTQYYWMFTTGAGAGILIAAIMGLIVGVVVVTQTIYATTVDHLREYGTLKAMGASNRYIYRVIITQAVISAVIGYLLAIILSVGLVRMSSGNGATIMLPWQLAAGMFLLTVVMCIGASIVSINKVTRLDPAMVFKG